MFASLKCEEKREMNLMALECQANDTATERKHTYRRFLPWIWKQMTHTVIRRYNLLCRTLKIMQFIFRSATLYKIVSAICCVSLCVCAAHCACVNENRFEIRETQKILKRNTSNKQSFFRRDGEKIWINFPNAWWCRLKKGSGTGVCFVLLNACIFDSASAANIVR